MSKLTHQICNFIEIIILNFTEPCPIKDETETFFSFFQQIKHEIICEES